MSSYKFKELNNKHKEKMSNSIQNIKEHFEWENNNLLAYFSGKLPEITLSYQDTDLLNTKLYELKKIYNSYNYFCTNQKTFLQEVENKLNEIHRINPHWYGLSFDKVKYYTDLHHACILTGEGGVGKSYFIFQLEKEICNKDVPHLCVYGKYQEIAFDIDFEEIISFAQNQDFIFIVDAFNELTDDNKKIILDGIKQLLEKTNIRIIITYRTYALTKLYCQKLESLIPTKISFPGISFESALNIISKYPIKELYKYSDILFSNNALLISKLIKILITFPEDRNSINSITYILEHDFKETVGLDYWKKTKELTRWMYSKNRKEISFSDVSKLISDSRDYIEKLISTDFIFTYARKEDVYIGFQIELVHDFLIARFFFDDCKNKTDTEIINLLSTKVKAFPSAQEAFILCLFDKLGSDYKRIYNILDKSTLLNELTPEVLRKVKFNSADIQAFNSVFEPKNPIGQFLWFAGFSDKPFNCVNFQNQLLLESSENQLSTLSKCLTSRYDSFHLAQRLKNLLYFVNYTKVDDVALEEYFYAALWCCSAPNKNIRIIARKLLFDIVRIRERFIDILISVFPKIYDFYIQDAIVETLFYHKNNKVIEDFFQGLKFDYNFLSAVNNARISDYLNEKYEYINWKKKNLFSLARRKLSNEFESLLFKIDAFDKDLLHFRYWNSNKLDQMYPNFLNTDKQLLLYVNNELKKNFSCVKTGECNCEKLFEDAIVKLFEIPIKNFPVNSFLKSFEKLIYEIFRKYDYQFDEKDVNQTYRNFNDSLLRKLTVISQDIFYGSLMCNYFTDDFSSFDDPEDFIGYKVYYPLKYEPSQNITAPIPTYNEQIEKLQVKALNNIDYSMNKNEVWVKDAKLTKKNILSLITTPIEHGKNEWIMLGAQISLKDSRKDTNSWQDKYDISCCTSGRITITGDENDRYLTIEHRDYYGLLEDYCCNASEPELCMTVRQVSAYNELLDETNLLLPPAKLIIDLNLKPDYQNLSWVNDKGEVVIHCNNNKSDYYADFIKRSIFIRKDIFDEYVKTHTLKYFVFTERLIPGHGFENDTCFDLEIKDGEIIKEFLHYQTSHVRNTSESRCYCCPIGLNKEYERIRNKHFVIPNIINLLISKDNLFDDENIEIYTGGEEP